MHNPGLYARIELKLRITVAPVIIQYGFMSRLAVTKTVQAQDHWDV